MATATAPKKKARKKAPKKKKGRTGQPTKCNAAIRDTIAESIEGGAPKEASAIAAGISKRTYHNWMEWGCDASEEGRQNVYSRFYERIEKAIAEDVRRNSHVISEAGKKDWRAAAFHLERRYPEDYGKRLVLKAEQIDFDSLSIEEIRRLAAGEEPEKVLGSRLHKL